MIKKICFGVGAFLAPVLVFAEGNGDTFQINSAFSDMDLSGLITSLGNTLFTNISAAIGLAAGIWGLTLIWQKVRRVPSKS